MTVAPPLYYLIRPARLGAGDVAQATLVLLHGRGADELDLLPLVEGWGDGFDVVTVRAPHPLTPGYQWYELKALGEPEAGSFAAGLQYLKTVLEVIPVRWPALARPWVLVGFSQGALLAVAAAGNFLLPNLRGVVALSGYLPEGLSFSHGERLAGLPVFWGHGRQDPVLPFTWGEAAVARLTTLGAIVDFHPYPMGHAVIPDEVSDLKQWLHQRVRGSE